MGSSESKMTASAEEAKKTAHWEAFYASASVAMSPSSFAKHITDEGLVKAGTKLVDIGCGNGRDSLHFASQGLDVLGVDASVAAINALNASAHPGAVFRALDVKDAEFGAALADRSAFYMRFFLHAVTVKEETPIFAALAAAPPGARVFLEFRTRKDPLMQKGEVLSENERIFGHYRRFLDVDAVVAQLAGVGFTSLLHKSEEGNLSVVDDDNPVLGRIIADKPAS